MYFSFIIPPLVLPNMMLRGLQYFNDAQGRPNKVLVDLDLYGAEFAVFVQQLQQKYGNTVGITPPPPRPVVAPQASSRVLRIEQILAQARQFLGTPYRTGGTTRTGMDCSGLALVAFAAVGLTLPRVSRDQATMGRAIQRSELEVGDLVFFATGTPGRINHVGIVCAGKGPTARFIHASSSRGVMESDLALDYWSNTYMAARRVV